VSHRMAALSITLFLLAAGGLPGAQAASIMAVQCNGCSLAQEEQAAIAWPGFIVRFVYNLTNHRIRKFHVVLEVNGVMSGPAGEVFVVGESSRRLAEEAVDLSGYSETSVGPGDAVRVLYEMTVDHAMSEVFQTLDRLHSEFPDVFTKSWPGSIDVLNTPHIPALNPRDIAFDSGNGGSAFNNFIARVRDVMGGEPPCRQHMAKGACDLIHGVKLRAAGLFVITPRGPLLGVSFDRLPTDTEVVYCDEHQACVSVKVSTTSSGISVSYVRALERITNTALPVGPLPPFTQNHSGEHARVAAERTARDLLRRFGSTSLEFTGNPGACTVAYLSCAYAREARASLACTIACRTH